MSKGLESKRGWLYGVAAAAGLTFLTGCESLHQNEHKSVTPTERVGTVLKSPEADEPKQRVLENGCVVTEERRVGSVVVPASVKCPSNDL